ncbi:MAG: TIGR01906 family membrane protein [Dehalococcoidales bacterium]|nr:MAG: TIGR01906 family membrane protein [Dehalococcoidales bacterium]
MKALNITARLVFIICLPFLLLTASLAVTINSLWLYQHGFDKYDVSQRTGLSQEELEKAARGLISYFNSGEEYISLTVMKDGEPFQLFNQREILHLKDVKGLIWLDYWVLLGTLAYTLAYASVHLLYGRTKDWPSLPQSTAWGSGLTITLMLALGIGSLLGFDQIFYQFHLFSFANDLWKLDPKTDYLIMLFPRGYFYDVTLFFSLATTAWAAILGGTTGGYLLFTRRRFTSPAE